MIYVYSYISTFQCSLILVNLHLLVKKTSSKSPSEISFSSRLLWQNNGEWLDRWFSYSDGILAGYKDSSTTKPAEILVDIRTCKLTTLDLRQSTIRNINLFQVIYD